MRPVGTGELSGIVGGDGGMVDGTGAGGSRGEDFGITREVRGQGPMSPPIPSHPIDRPPGGAPSPLRQPHIAKLTGDIICVRAYLFLEPPR